MGSTRSEFDTTGAARHFDTDYHCLRAKSRTRCSTGIFMKVVEGCDVVQMASLMQRVGGISTPSTWREPVWEEHGEVIPAAAVEEVDKEA